MAYWPIRNSNPSPWCIDMTDFHAPAPGFAHAFDMRVKHGKPVKVGQLASGGERTYLPVSGGDFTGEGVTGILVGGGETLFSRADGVTVIEAVYYIECTAGWMLRGFGNGYRTTQGDFIGTRMTLLFEADEEGPLAHLATNAFIAERLPQEDIMAISRII